MKRAMKKIIFLIYHEMQKHYWSFRILVVLKECGITRKINSHMSHFSNGDVKIKRKEEMKQFQRFYEMNEERITYMLGMLCDEKSKKVWERVMRYRMYGESIPKEFYSEGDQYFCKDIIALNDGEVFLDGGAYTGDTIQQFIDTCNRRKKSYKKIIAFEPDKNNFALVSKFYGNKDNILIINKGLSKEKGELCFQEAGVSSKLSEHGTCRIPVISIDSIPECKEATFIKMDIEGAEMDALWGAQQTIMRNHPKLAICIYHSEEDMVQIAEWIHALVPEYRLYIRHHSRRDMETVLYAV